MRAEARRAQLVQVAALEPLVLMEQDTAAAPEPPVLELAVMANPGKLSAEQRDEIVQLVKADPDLPLAEVAETYGVTRQSITQLLALRGVGRPPRPRQAWHDSKWIAAVVEAYSNPDVPLNLLAEAFGRERSTIRRLAIDSGAPPRPRGNFHRPVSGRFETGADGLPHWVTDQPPNETLDNPATPPITEEPRRLTAIEAPRTQEDRGIYVKLDTAAVKQLHELADAHKLDLEHEAHSLIEQALKRMGATPPKPTRVPRWPIQSIKLSLPPDLFSFVRRTAQDSGRETRDLIADLLYDMLPPTPTPEEEFKMALPTPSQPAPRPAQPARNGNGHVTPLRSDEHQWVMTYMVKRAITHPAHSPEEAMAKLRELVGQDAELLSIVRGG